jgi:hypothetical protein
MQIGLMTDAPNNSADDDAAIDQALADIRRAGRRVWIARAAGAVAGGGTTWLGIYLTDLVSAHLPEAEQPGLGMFFGLIAIGAAVFVFVNKRLSRSDDAADDEPGMNLLKGGIFDETLATTSSLMVRQRITLLGWLCGDAAGQQFELIDGAGAWCGAAREDSSLLWRLLFTSRRPLDIVVDDVGEEALRVRRPFVFWHDHGSVYAGERLVGNVERGWSPLRSVYRVRSADGSQELSLTSGWLFKSRFRVLRGGEEVGALERLRKPWYVRMFQSSLVPEQDRFALSLPAGSDLDTRRLLVGALFLVDASH